MTQPPQLPCTFTTDETDAPLIRLLIEPNVHNGLRLASSLMVDKIAEPLGATLVTSDVAIKKLKIDGLRIVGW